MAKQNRPTIENPLAGMGLDDIVRGITNPSSPAPKPEPRPEAKSEPEPEPELRTSQIKKKSGQPTADDSDERVEAPARSEQKAARQRRQTPASTFDEYLQKYTGISEQGIAIWLPKEVKKRLEMIRINASRNIPLRSLAAAIIMTYISENEDSLEDL